MKKLNLIALMTTLFCLSSTLVKANTLEMKGDTIPVFIGVLLSGSSNGGHHMPLPYQSPISVCYDSSNATLIFEGDNLLSGTAYSIYNDLGVSVCSGFILFFRKRRPVRTGFPSPRMPSTTSAVASPRTFWTLSISSRRNLSVPASSPPTTTSRPTRNSCPCSPATFPLPMPMPPPSSVISASRRRLRCGKG